MQTVRVAREVGGPETRKSPVPGLLSLRCSKLVGRSFKEGRRTDVALPLGPVVVTIIESGPAR